MYKLLSPFTFITCYCYREWVSQHGNTHALLFLLFLGCSQHGFVATHSTKRRWGVISVNCIYTGVESNGVWFLAIFFRWNGVQRNEKTVTESEAAQDAYWSIMIV
jgi:hypothetical protein